MSLFQLGDFILRSGKQSGWKIQCEYLTNEDWRALAFMAAEILPPFGSVEPVPTGGIAFATALRFYADPDESDTILIAEDVVTTGGSMERIREGREAIGICVFVRGTPPDWVTPLFQMRVLDGTGTGG